MNQATAASPEKQRLQQAIAHHQAGRLAEAEAVYNDILRDNPEDANALQLKGLIHAARNETGQAITCMENSLSINPNQPSVHYNLGMLFSNLGRHSEAIGSLTAALNLNPNHLQASLMLASSLRQEGRLEDAEQQLELLLIRKQDYALAHIHKGLVLQAMKKPDEAIKAYNTAITLEPDNADARYNRGVAYEVLGEKDKAQQDFLQAAKLNPSLAGAHYNLGVHAKKADELEAARTHFSAACAAKPDYIEALNNLGTVEQALGNYDAAKEAYDQVLRLNPGFAEAWYNFALLHQQQNQIEAALEAYQKALSINNKLPEAHFNIGVLEHGLGRLDMARAAYEKAISLKKDFAPAYSRLASILVVQGDPKKGEKMARLAVRYAKNDPESLHSLGLALKHQDRLEEAKINFQKCLQYKPDYAGAHLNLANVYKEMGELEQATAHYRTALELSPDYAESYNNLGNIHLIQGEKKNAEEMFRKAVELKPDFSHAYRHLASTIRFKPGDPIINQMAEFHARDNLSDEDRISIGFALAKAYDDIKQYDKVFPLLNEANALRRKDYPDYSTQGARESIEQVIANYSAEFLATAPTSGIASKTPIFVTGMPRSGTTLVEQILASHPDVFGGDELDYMRTIALDETFSIKQKSFIDAAHDYTADDLAMLGNLYLKRLKKLAPKARFITDKMPSNTLYGGLIHMLLPGARIINCRRDPLSVCFSIYKMYFSGPQPFAYNLEELAYSYLFNQRLMDHWKKALPDQVYDLHYETLVENQEEETRKLLDFCQIEWNDACLEFYKSDRSVKTASLMQVRTPIYKSAMKAWEPYRKELEPIARILGINE